MIRLMLQRPCARPNPDYSSTYQLRYEELRGRLAGESPIEGGAIGGAKRTETRQSARLRRDARKGCDDGQARE